MPDKLSLFLNIDKYNSNYSLTYKSILIYSNDQPDIDERNEREKEK